MDKLKVFILLLWCLFSKSFINIHRIPPKQVFRKSFNSAFASILDRGDTEFIRHLQSFHVREVEVITTCLPTLTNTQKRQLLAYERVQTQNRIGRQGYGWVALDVKAATEDVFTVLKDFSRYHDIIPTVRSARILSRSLNQTIAEFRLSRFRLPVSVVQTVNDEKKLIRFSLDSSRPNPAVSKVEGFWYVETPEERADHARVWLYVTIVASNLLPNFIVDYAASRALPRATEWLQTYFSQK